LLRTYALPGNFKLRTPPNGDSIVVLDFQIIKRHRKLKILTWQALEQEIVLFTAWNRRRYLSGVIKGNNMSFEFFGYTKSLLDDLGLSSHRKGFIKDILVPCKASNFLALKHE
jgi:hypothetical protein